MRTREHLCCGMQQGDSMSPVQFLFLLSRQSVANLSRITSKAWRDAGGIPPLQEPNGVDGVDFLGRVVTPERIKRERSIERKKRKHVEKLGGDRKSDHDLESGLVFLMSKREISLFVCQHVTGAIQSNGLIHSLHKGPHIAATKQHEYQPCLIVFRRISSTKDLAVRAKRGDMSRRRNNLWQRTRYLPV